MEQNRQEEIHRNAKRFKYQYTNTNSLPAIQLDFSNKKPLPVGMILGSVTGIYNFFDNTQIIAPRLGKNGETIMCSGNDLRLKYF